MSDIHAQKAHEIFNKPINKVSKKQRKLSAVINFGILYGTSSKNIQEITRSKYENDNQSSSVL